MTQFPPPPQAPPPPPGYYQPPVSDYPVQVNIVRPERQSRVLALFSIPFFLIRYLLLIPQFFVLYFVGIVGIFVVWFGYWAVLFTGRNPEGLHNFAAGWLRWQTRVSAYAFGLTDRYPPFSMTP